MRAQLIVRAESGENFATKPVSSVAIEIPGDWVVVMSGHEAVAIVAPDVRVVRREEKP